MQSFSSDDLVNQTYSVLGCHVEIVEIYLQTFVNTSKREPENDQQ